MEQIENENYFECVPNISEGRNTVFLTDLKMVISESPGIRLLHSDIGNDAHRTVFTFTGNYMAILNILKTIYDYVAKRISMQNHSGAHPRIGAIDVCPIIPLFDTKLELAIQLAEELASWVGTTLSIPVFLYEHSATAEHRKNLASIRSGEYEGLKTKLSLPEWKPDFGPTKINSDFGATVIGARNLLIAYNINLKSKDVKKAKYIASRLRESGFTQINDSGIKVRISGACKNVKAIGWFMESYNLAQVSTNITDIEATNLIEIFNTCKEIAAEKNIELLGSELIGLIPKICLIKAGNILRPNGSETEKIDQAISYLGLDSIVPFNKSKRILEEVLF